MRPSYEELKKVFSIRIFTKENIRKFFKIIGICAILLLPFAIIYKDYLDGFSIKFSGILFIIICIIIATAIARDDRCMTIFKNNRANVNNYLINRYNFKVKNDLMIKQIGKAIYSFEYDIGIMREKNLIKNEELFKGQDFCLCMICKIYNISYMEYSELDSFMKERTNEIVMMPEEKSVKIFGEFSDKYKPEQLLFFMCQRLEYFEANLKKTLEKEKSTSDIEFEKKMLNILGKEKSEEYISSEDTNINSNPIDFSKSDFNCESIHGKKVVFKNYNNDSYFKKIFQKVLIINVFIALIYSTFYIINGYNIQSKYTTLLSVLLLILIMLSALLGEILLPSYVLTKKFGLREKRGEKFYGTLSNGIPFCVKPYRSKRFFENEFPSLYYDTQTNLKIALEIEKIKNYLSSEEILFITQNSNVEQIGENLIIYEEVRNANMIKEEMLEDTMNTILRKLSNILGIYNENIIAEGNNKYNIKSMCCNLINRCFDIFTFFEFAYSIPVLYVYGRILYNFVIDIIRHL